MYQIIVKGYLDQDWCDWLDGQEVSHHLTDQGIGVTSLRVALPDQSALHGLLTRLHLFNLEVLFVKRLGMDDIADLERN